MLLICSGRFSSGRAPGMSRTSRSTVPRTKRSATSIEAAISTLVAHFALYTASAPATTPAARLMQEKSTISRQRNDLSYHNQWETRT